MFFHADPLSRRSIWNVLEANKKNKVLVISTHNLEEAGRQKTFVKKDRMKQTFFVDLLGDRIAILHYGELKVVGTNVSLRQNFGQFYQLTVVAEKTHLKNVGRLTEKYFPTCEKDIGPEETVYKLPVKNSHDKLIRLLLDLEKNSLSGYGLKAAGMEDIFLAAIGKEEIKKQRNTFPLKPHKPPPLRQFLVHIWSLLIRRFHFSRRDWKGLCSQTIIPILVVLLAMVALHQQRLTTVPENPEEWELIASEQFKNSEQGNEIFYASNFVSEPSSLAEAELFFGYSFGPVCVKVKGKAYSKKCTLPSNHTNSASPSNKALEDVCSCSTGVQICKEDEVEEFSKAPWIHLPSGDKLLNITGRNITEYLLGSDRWAFRRRYGGIEMKDRIFNKISDYIIIWFDGRVGPIGESCFLCT